MPEVRLKVGDTLIADCIYRDANGDPVDLTTAGIAIASKVRSADGLSTYDLTITLKDQAATLGGFRIRGDTTGWAPGRLAWDIRYTTAAGDSISSETVCIDLQAAVS